MLLRQDPSIAGIVCDSPFSKLTELMVELVEEQRLPIPKYLMKLAIGFMRRSVRKRAGFDILEVAPIDKVGEAFVPALFGHADGDLFVLKHHSQALHEKYAGEKNFISCARQPAPCAVIMLWARYPLHLTSSCGRKGYDHIGKKNRGSHESVKT